MGFFKSLFGPSKSDEERQAELRIQTERITPDIVAAYSAASGDKRDEVVNLLAEKYNRTRRGIIAILSRAGAYRPRLDPPRKASAMETHLNQLSNFKPSRSAFGIDGETGIAFEESKNRICLLFHDAEKPSHRFLSSQDLYSAEVVEEDGASLTRVTHSTKLGNAIVGGLLLGGVGAVVGGLSGKSGTETSRVITKLVIRLTINDTATPTHNITLINQAVETPTETFKTARTTAAEWNDLLAVLIKRSQGGGVPTKPTRRKVSNPTQAEASVADELKKLLDLHQSGALSLDEFRACKAQLLGSISRKPEK